MQARGMPSRYEGSTKRSMAAYHGRHIVAPIDEADHASPLQIVHVVVIEGVVLVGFTRPNHNKLELRMAGRQNFRRREQFSESLFFHQAANASHHKVAGLQAHFPHFLRSIIGCLRRKARDVNSISDVGNFASRTEATANRSFHVFPTLRQDAIATCRCDLFRNPEDGLAQWCHTIVEQESVHRVHNLRDAG